MTRRTFIAIDLFPGERLNRTIQAVKGRFSSENIRWTGLNPAHITLSFIGETSGVQVNGISRLLEERLRCTGPVELGIRGTGFFGSARNPKVLWAGVVLNEPLYKLHLAVKSVVVDAGLTPDDKPFRPHLTIGRVRSFSGRIGTEDLLPPSGEETLQKTIISEVVFYESILKPEGAIYQPIEVISLL